MTGFGGFAWDVGSDRWSGWNSEIVKKEEQILTYGPQRPRGEQWAPICDRETTKNPARQWPVAATEGEVVRAVAGPPSTITGLSSL